MTDFDKYEPVRSTYVPVEELESILEVLETAMAPKIAIRDDSMEMILEARKRSRKAVEVAFQKVNNLVVAAT